MADIINDNNTDEELLVSDIDVKEKPVSEAGFFSDAIDIITKDSLISAVTNRFGASISSLTGKTLEDGKKTSNDMLLQLIDEGVSPDILADWPATFETDNEAFYTKVVYQNRQEAINEVRSKYGIIGNIGLDLIADAPLAGFGKLTKLNSALVNARRGMIGSTNSVKAKIAVDAALGGAAGLSYEFALDNLQYGHDGDYLMAGGFGVAGGTVLSGIGSAFGLLTKSAVKRDSQIGFDNELDGQYNDTITDSEIKMGIIENSIKDQALMNNTVVSRKSLNDYASAKIDFNTQVSKQLDTEILNINGQINKIDNELTTVNSVLKETPNDLESFKIQKNINEINKKQIKIDEKIINDRSATQTGNIASKNNEKITSDLLDDFVINVIDTNRKNGILDLQNKTKDLEKQLGKLKKNLEKEHKIKSLEKKIDTDEKRTTYNKSEIKLATESAVNKRIADLDLNGLTAKQIKKIKDDARNTLNYKKNIFPELDVIVKNKIMKNKDLLELGKRNIISKTKDFQENTFNKENNLISSEMDEVNNFFSKNNEKLAEDLKREFLNGDIPDEFKTEFGYAKSKLKNKAEIDKMESKKTVLNEKIEQGKLLSSILQEKNVLNNKKDKLIVKKKNATLKKTDLSLKSKSINKAKTEIDTHDFTNQSLKKKLPDFYHDMLKDIEGKTDPDLAALGVNYIIDKSLFANGFRDIKVTVDTKIGSMPKNNYKDIKVGDDSYHDAVGIDVDNITPEQKSYLDENGSEAWKIKYMKFDNKGDVSDIDGFINIENTEDGSFYDFIKFGSDWFKPFAEKMSTDKNDVIANVGDFFLNSITKRHGKLDKSDIGLVIESEKRVNETNYVNALETYIPLKEKYGVKVDKELLKEDLGLFARDDSNNIKNSQDPYDLLVKEVYQNIAKNLDPISERAVNSKHEKFQNYNTKWTPKRSFNGDKINDIRSRVSLDEIDRGIKESIIKSQPEIIDIKTKDGRLYVDVLASGYRAVLFNSKSGFNNFDRFISSNQTVEDMVNFLEIQLKNKTGMDLFENADDLQDILDFYKKRKEKSKKLNKSKLLLDEGHTTILKDKNGNTTEFKISDLTENNIDILARQSIEELSGRTIVAERGITLREDFFEDLNSQALKLEEDKFGGSGRSATVNKKRVNEINNMMEVLRASVYGESDIKNVTPNINTASKISNVIGNLITASNLDFAFLSYIPEMARAIAINPVHGVKTLLSNTFNDVKGIKNGYRYLNKKTGQYELINPKHRLYEKHFGSMRTVKTQAINRNQNDFGGVVESDSGDKTVNSAVFWTKKLANTMTGFNSYVEAASRKISIEAGTYDLIKMAKEPEYKSNLFSKNSLESFKFSQKKFNNIIKVVDKNIKTIDNEAVIDLDAINQKNPEVYGDIIELMNANTDQVVQRTNVGDKLFFQTTDNPVLRLAGGVIVKFRTFVLQAFGKDFARMQSYKDYDRMIKQTFAMITGSALAYPLKVEKGAMQSDNYDEYKEKMYQPKQIITGMVNHISWMGLPMMMIETPLKISGNSLYYDSVRSSGLDGSFITGNPYWKFVEAGSKLMSVTLKAAGLNQGDITKDELKSITSQIPFSEFARMTDFYKDISSGLSKFDNETERKEERIKFKNLSVF